MTSGGEIAFMNELTRPTTRPPMRATHMSHGIDSTVVPADEREHDRDREDDHRLDDDVVQREAQATGCSDLLEGRVRVDRAGTAGRRPWA